MRTHERPALGKRAGRTSKLKYCNERSNPSTNSLHWSRHPTQRKADADLLAFFGLVFARGAGNDVSPSRQGGPK